MFLSSEESSAADVSVITTHTAAVLANFGKSVAIVQAGTGRAVDDLLLPPRSNAPGRPSHVDARAAGLEETGLDGVWLFRGREETGFNLTRFDDAQALLDRLVGVVDMVLVAGGPVLSSPEAVALAAVVDGVVVVLNGQQTHRRAAIRTRAIVENVGGRIVGSVVTGLDGRAAERYEEAELLGARG